MLWSMGSELDGRHALITGGGTGIGAAAAAQLHAAGAKLSLLGRRMEPLRADRRNRRRRRDPVRRHRPRRRSTRAFDEARAANGPIDMLIVNAGIADSAPFHKMTRDSWDRIIATNLTAAFDCAQAALARPAGEREWPPGVRRLGREPARRALCRAIMPPRSTGCSA